MGWGGVHPRVWCGGYKIHVSCYPSLYSTANKKWLLPYCSYTTIVVISSLNAYKYVGWHFVYKLHYQYSFCCILCKLYGNICKVFATCGMQIFILVLVRKMTFITAQIWVVFWWSILIMHFFHYNPRTIISY